MRKYLRGFIFLFSGLMFFSGWVCAQNSKKPINEIPMYGEIPRTSQEKEADDRLVQSVIKEYGSKEAAFQKAFEFGWNYFDKGDYATAIKRFNQAWLIDPNEPRSFNAFGMLADAQGDHKAALRWYKKGAEKGDPKAQFNLGNAYFNEKDVKPDYIEAAKWFRLAAEQNLEWAQNMIGFCYELGLGVPRNVAESEKWYAKADANGATEEEKNWRHPKGGKLPPEGEMMKE